MKRLHFAAYVVGCLFRDIIIHTPRPVLGPDEKRPVVARLQILPGGMGAKVAVLLTVLARLSGIRPDVHFVGMVGNDFPEALRWFSEAGVCCKYVFQTQSPTSVSVLHVHRGSRSAGMILSHELRSQILPEAAASAVSSAPLIVVDGAGNLGAQIAVAKRASGIVVLNLEYETISTRRLSRYADVIICSRQYLKARFPGKTLRGSLRLFIQHTTSSKLKICGVTAGAKGSWFVDVGNQELIHTPAYPVGRAIAGGVGAGDAHVSGLSFALSIGKPVRDALAFAAAVASFVIQNPAFPPAISLVECFHRQQAISGKQQIESSDKHRFARITAPNEARLGRLHFGHSSSKTTSMRKDKYNAPRASSKIHQPEIRFATRDELSRSRTSRRRPCPVVS